MDHPGVGNEDFRQDVGHHVQGLETLVYSHFQNRRRGIKCTIDCTSSATAPSTADPVGPFAAVPGRGMSCLIQTPGNQITPAKRARQWGHA